MPITDKNGISMDDTVGTLLFKDKQVKLILTLANSGREWHIADLAKEAKVTYVHTSKFISKCEEAGIIASERHGRVKMLYLTDKGKEIAVSAASIMSKIALPETPKPSAPQK